MNDKYQVLKALCEANKTYARYVTEDEFHKFYTDYDSMFFQRLVMEKWVDEYRDNDSGTMYYQIMTTGEDLENPKLDSRNSCEQSSSNPPFSAKKEPPEMAVFFCLCGSTP